MRLKYYDYSSEGYYFITAVTGNRMPFFGAVVFDEMVVTEPGYIAGEEIRKTGQLRKNVFIDEFVIMPDHVHLIMIIFPRSSVARPRSLVARYEATGCEPDYYSSISPNPDTVSSIVRSYKSAVTKRCHEAGIDDFSWQRGFYDRIIRDQKELNAIRKYIRLNPERWWQRNCNFLQAW